MNKKFLSAILFGALMVTSTGTFVSCKDYDDDIDGLQTQVDANKSDCAAGIQAINSQISALQSALTTAQSTADAAKKAAADAATAAEAAKKAGEAAAAQAKADAIAKAIEEAEALKAWVVAQKYVTEEELAEALLPVSAKISAIEETLDQITVYITENLEANLQSAVKNIMALQEDLAIQQATLEEYEALMEELKAGDEELWAELTSTREGLQQTETALNNLLEDATGQLWAEIALARQELSGAISALTNIQADDKAALMSEIEQILLANKTTSETLAAILNTQADDKAELKNEIEQILLENTKLSETLATLINTQTANKAELETTLGTLEESLETKIKNLEDKLGLNSSTSAKDIEALAAEIAKLAADNVKTAATIAALETSHAADKAALEKLVADVKAELSKSIADQIAALNTTISATMTEELDKVWAALTEGNTKLNADINKNAENIQGLNDQLLTLHLLVKGYLTSMTFAPSFYVDGIEAIQFMTLKYNPWIKLETDEEQQINDYETLSDGSTEAHYYVSPSYIDLNSIESLDVLMNEATNSRTATPVSAKIKGIENGKLTVTLKKNTTEAFECENGEFKVIALQANVNRGSLNPNVKSHEVYTVTSDWARIYEAHYTPAIHAANYTAVPHLWSYAEATAAKEGEYIIAKSDYKTPINLNELVKVCLTDANGNEIFLNATQAAAYGLKFQFKLVEDYKLKKGTPQETDQQLFATIAADENGIYTMTSQAMDGTKENADAVGREPLVQVVLWDNANEEVVDVNYFKIKWTAVTNSIKLGVLDVNPAFVDEFECGGNYTFQVKTADMNKFFYTKLNMSKEEFHIMYKPENSPNGFKLYSDEECSTVAQNVGTIKQLLSSGSTTTYNIEWNYTQGNITKEEWAAKKVVRTVYMKYVNQANTEETITFGLTFTLNIENMGLVAGYVQTYWSGTLATTNADKMFQVNPALTTDAAYGSANAKTCRFITNMLHGYNVTGISASNLKISDIVNDYVEGVKFVFDADRAEEMGEEFDEVWSVSVDGTQLSINGEVAAEITTISEVPYIKLYENPITNASTAGVPTEAAKSLVGKMVPVQLVGKHCSTFESVLDQYLVHFIEPLAATFNGATGELKDLVTGGSSLRIATVLTVKEKFGDKRDVVYINEDGKLAVNSELNKWYDVKPATWDLANAKTNLNIEGNNVVITNEFKTLFSAHNDKYKLEVVPNTSGYPVELKFHNNSGTHIQQAFKIQIPVYVETKWNSKLTAEPTYFEVTIVPGVTE